MEEKLFIKLGEDSIDAQNPWNGDKLNRSFLACAIIDMIKDEVNPFIISIDGKWGSGKTFFLKRLKYQLETPTDKDILKSKHFKTIFFNAWEDDFCSDPLIAILGQLWEYIKTQDKDKELQKSIMAIAKHLSGKFFFEGVNAAAKLCSGGIFDPKLSQADFKTKSGKILDAYSQAKEQTAKLKELLNALAQIGYEKNGKPLVFIIDELDRCLPTFAIELLERVKHIFNIPHVVFIMGIDKQQLEKSIQSVYGNIDAGVYLQRFFDMDFVLPENKADAFCDHLFEKHKIKEFFTKKCERINNPLHRQEFEDFTVIFKDFCNVYNMSLREIEHAARLFAVASKSIGDNYFMYPFTLAFLIILRIKCKDIYYDYISRKINAKKVLDYLEPVFEKMLAMKSGGYYVPQIELELYCMEMDTDAVLEALGQISANLLPKKHLSARILSFTDEKRKAFKKNLEMCLNNAPGYRSIPNKGTLSYLSKKLELAESVLA